MQDSNLRRLILDLFEIQAVKFGDFTLKSGIQSPVYFDLRVIVSYPRLMVEVSDLLFKAAKDHNVVYQSVCGVPYTALPLATCIACKDNVPMLIRRKEAKDYGTKKLIEGSYQTGDHCLIVEDVVTSGGSVAETAEILEGAGLKVTDSVVLLDREQGGKTRLKRDGITLYSVFTLTEVFETLHAAGRIDDVMVSRVRQFIEDNQCELPATTTPAHVPVKEKVLTYAERADLCTQPVAKKILRIMAEKKTNLALSADVTSADKLLELADSLGPYICILKTHIDILQDFSADLPRKLQSLASTHNFVIFEDRKFADIGQTVREQYSGGVYRIADWAELTNAHSLPGPGVVQGLKQEVADRSRACLLIAEMSSKENLLNSDYAKATVSMAEAHDDFVIGFICQHKLSNKPTLIHMTPGVKLEEGGDQLGQQYLTPDTVIAQRRSDVIIVGRGITAASDPVQTAKRYRDAAYNAYQSTLLHQ